MFLDGGFISSCVRYVNDKSRKIKWYFKNLEKYRLSLFYVDSSLGWRRGIWRM